MAKRRRKKMKKEGADRPGEFARYKGEVISIDDIAQKWRDGDRSIKNEAFYCPGRDKYDKERLCTCRLQPCALDSERVEPYFAHRDKDRTTHIENCDAVQDSVEEITVKRKSKSLSKFNVERSLNNILFSNEPMTKNPNGGKNGGGGEVDPPKRTRGAKTKKRTTFVPITNLGELYEALTICSEKGQEVETEDGFKVEELFINSKTIQDYRNGTRPFNGPKVIVATPQIDDFSLPKKLREKGNNALWLVGDPYVRDTKENVVFYMLDFEGDSDLMFEYKKKKIDNAKENLILLFGNTEDFEWDDKGIRICRIVVSDRKGRQVSAIKNSKEKSNTLNESLMK